VFGSSVVLERQRGRDIRILLPAYPPGAFRFAPSASFVDLGGDCVDAALRRSGGSPPQRPWRPDREGRTADAP